MLHYKYVSASSAIRILEDMRLKVALPNECNDPFEFTPRSMMTLTRNYMLNKLRTDPEHFRPVYEDMVSDGYSEPFSEFLRALPSEIQKQSPAIRTLLRTHIVEYDLNVRNDASRFAGILCLSATNDSIPMWSHYGHDHRGVVIGVRQYDDAFFHGTGGKVRYVKHRVSVDPRVEAGTRLWWKQINRVIFRKSWEWNYEQEFRIVFRLKDLIPGKLEDGRTAFFLDVWESTIHSVIFGCLIPPKDEATIRELLKSKKRFSNLKVFRAQRNPKQFSLEIVSADKP